MKVKLELLDRDIEGDILEVRAVKFGNSAHIVLPKKYLGKKGKLIIAYQEIVTDEYASE